MDVATQAADGHRWTLRLYPAATSNAAIFWIPALGVPARKYEPMAQALASRGISVAVHEWRGNDTSSLRASRHCDWGYRELLMLDIPASFAEARKHMPDCRWSIGGHSLGGQLAALYLAMNPQSCFGLVLMATGVPWSRTFRGQQRLGIALFARFIPVVTWLFGYFPGDRLRWAGREAAGVMRQWSTTVLAGRYDDVGLPGDIEAELARVDQPAMGLRFADDWLVPAASLEALFAKLGSGARTREIFDAGRLGVTADHFRWMKSPDAVAECMADWLGINP